MFRKVFAAMLLLVGLHCTAGWAQAVQHTILNVDVQNFTGYAQDVSDVSTYATNPNRTTASVPKNFAETINIGDIVAVNGQPAKGTFLLHLRNINLNPAPAPGQAIADVTRGNVGSFSFEFLGADGAPIGTIHCYGLGGAGTPPPGAPLAAINGNNAIVGGTGAFLGARGQLAIRVANTGRTGSMTEDPANRRTNAAGGIGLVLDVIPMEAPQILTAPGGPAVTHSRDFSLVTASNPAVAGETLSVFLTGLGPTRPGANPGQPFPASPLQTVNSPVVVTMNGQSATVTAAVGYPGAVGGYQVNFQVPPNTASGTATVQISAAWITGPPVTINIR